MAASVIIVWMCVWMGECGMYCTALWAVVRLEKRYKNADHLPFTIKTHDWNILELLLYRRSSQNWPTLLSHKYCYQYIQTFFILFLSWAEGHVSGDVYCVRSCSSLSSFLQNGMAFYYLFQQTCHWHCPMGHTHVSTYRKAKCPASFQSAFLCSRSKPFKLKIL